MGLPDFWENCWEGRGPKKAWPQSLDASSEPPLVKRLAAEGRWLEQEVLALDARLRRALAALGGGPP